MARHLQPTPSIVVEDVDRIQTRLEFQSPPSYTLKIQDNNNCHSPLSLCASFGTIKPDVDAYVTPLSLCQQPSTPISPSVPVSFPVEFTCTAICFAVLLKLIDWIESAVERKSNCGVWWCDATMLGHVRIGEQLYFRRYWRPKSSSR